jgi:hypothetical protein
MFEYFYFVYMVVEPMVCHKLKMASNEHYDKLLMGIKVDWFISQDL